MSVRVNRIHIMGTELTELQAVQVWWEVDAALRIPDADVRHENPAKHNELKYCS